MHISSRINLIGQRLPYQKGKILMTVQRQKNFSILKIECIYRHKPFSLHEANALINCYIHFYNHERILLSFPSYSLAFCTVRIFWGSLLTTGPFFVIQLQKPAGWNLPRPYGQPRWRTPWPRVPCVQQSAYRQPDQPQSSL